MVSQDMLRLWVVLLLGLKLSPPQPPISGKGLLFRFLLFLGADDILNSGYLGVHFCLELFASP